MITFGDYQRAAARTANTYEDDTLASAIFAMGLSGEAGEVTDYLKKVIGHGHDLSLPKLVDELGDVLWYVAVLAEHFDIPLEIIAQANVDKLKERYPQGFSVASSVNRR